MPAPSSPAPAVAPGGREPAWRRRVRPARAATVRGAGPRWRAPVALAAAACIVGAACLLDGPMGPSARVALAVFGLAIVAWSVLGWAETPVALGGALAVTVLGVLPPGTLHASLGGSLMWLMLCAFVLAAALRSTGLAQRWALGAVAACGTVRGLFWRLTLVITATAFVVPSTSGRAALLLPVFLSLAPAMPGPQAVKALALLFPSVILLSACASLLGAGAHLVAVEFMRGAGAESVGYLQWAAWGLPFGLVSSLVACGLVLRLFLDAPQRAATLALPALDQPPGPAAGTPDPPATTAQARHRAAMALILVGVVLLWATGTWHGLDPATVALGAALLATVPVLTGCTLREALGKVEWNLLLFLAGTLVMGEALLASGAAAALAQGAMATLPRQALEGPGVIASAALLALLAHLVITSRTARATVLVPTVALPLAAAGVNPALLIFVTVVGSGFCQTFRASAKPVALFADAGPAGFGDADLRRLSLWLLPPTWLLLCTFGWFVWPRMGLPLLAA